MNQAMPSENPFLCVEYPKTLIWDNDRYSMHREGRWTRYFSCNHPRKGRPNKIAISRFYDDSVLESSNPPPDLDSLNPEAIQEIALAVSAAPKNKRPNWVIDLIDIAVKTSNIEALSYLSGIILEIMPCKTSRRILSPVLSDSLWSENIPRQYVGIVKKSKGRKTKASNAKRKLGN